MPQKMIKKQVGFKINESNEEEYTIRAVISSGLPDRQGEIIDQSSWNLDEYKKNPVVLWAHDHFQPAIGKSVDIFINAEGMLEAIIKFAVEESDFAKTIYKLYAGGFMRAFSVGFTSKTQEIVNDNVILKDNVLYEFSAVNVGADALALAKSKGIDISCFEKKFNIPKEKEGKVLSAKNRTSVEAARAALDEVLIADQAKDEKSNQVKKVKYNYKKILGKAARELIKVRNE
jgi:hypothetical protein